MVVDPPVVNARDQLHFRDGSVAFAGHYLHDGQHPAHTHSFVEVAVVMAGAGTHHSVAGRQELRVGDVLLLRHELAWTRTDPLLGYLLWTGPYSGQRRGVLPVHLAPDALAECVGHLDALAKLRLRPIGLHRGDIIGRLSLFLSGLARAVAAGGEHLPDDIGRTHPAVVDAMRMMEARPAHPWTLSELAAELHLAPGYLVRLFKSATGLPPMAFLSRHRVEIAAVQLLHTDQPIARIGESVGWPDQNYFARRFRAHYGLSASAYRARFSHSAVRLRTWDGPQRGSAAP